MRLKVSLLACSLLFMLSCSNSTVEKNEVAEVVSTQLDGQSVFKSVFFNLGDAAANIPSFQENIDLMKQASIDHPEFMQNYTANVDRYVEQIEKTNPAYFDQLKDAVYSQDFSNIKSAMEFGDLLILPTVIQTSLEEINYAPLKEDLQALDIESVDFNNEAQLQELSKAITKILSKYSDDQDNIDINTGRCFYFAGAVAITIAAVGNFVYAVNVAWTGNLNWNVNWSIPLQGGGYDYDHYIGEQLIKEIAFAFN